MAEKRTLYLDHAATTPVKPAVMDAMSPYFTEHFGNPSPIYGIARESKKAIGIARAQAATTPDAQEWKKRPEVHQNER
jgi:cysteine desulfurase